MGKTGNTDKNKGLVGSGFVYVLTNPAMPGLVKIGRTSRDPLSRLAEINAATGVPVPFQIACAIRALDHVAAEKEIHDRLRGCRVSRRREFFRCAPDVAIGEARAAAASPGRRFLSTGTGGRRERSGARRPLPPFLSGLAASAAGLAWTAAYDPILGGAWLAACLACLVTGRPHALADAISLPGVFGPAGSGLATAAAAAPWLVGYRYEEAAAYLAWLTA